MAIFNLNAAAASSAETVEKVYTDVPLTYIVKSIVMTNLTGAGYGAAPPTITISAPPIGGIQATASASLINAVDGTEVIDVVRIVVTNPGSGYIEVPTVTVSSTSGSATAVACIEPDPLVLEQRNQIISTIRTQILESQLSAIKDHLDRIQSAVGDEGDGLRSPYIRLSAGNWDGDSRLIARGMMMINLKETNKLDDLRSEINNPTVL